MVKPSPNALGLRIKVYNKILCMLQSASACKSLGMALHGLFRPSLQQSRVLQETESSGLTRIELSYYATNPASESLFWQADFLTKAARDVERVEAAVFEANYLEDAHLCYFLPLSSLLDHF